MKRNPILHLWLASLAILASPGAAADEFHYKDMLLGERAAGLGGAYAAISDDPSGIFYNPAGIVFSLESYFSLSANAFSSSTQVYKDLDPGQDYTYTSRALTPVFFGFTQSLGNNKLGFAVIVPSSDLFDQEDTITNLSSKPDTANVLRRKFFRSDITYLIGPAIARELKNDFTVGASLFGMLRFDKLIDNQFVIFNPDSASTPLEQGRYYFQDGFQNKTTFALLPKLGLQWMPQSKWSLGFTASMPFNVAGSGNFQVTRNKSDASTATKVVNVNGSYSNDIEVLRSDNLFHDTPQVLMLSLGAAYFSSKKWLLSGQFDLNGPDPGFREYPVRTTWNVAFGTEYYLAESWALRYGIFTNNAKTAVVDPNGRNQPPHVNLLGQSLGLSLFKPGSSLTLSGTYAFGSGQGQAIADSTGVQTVYQNSLTVYLTGSYQL